MRCCLCGWIVTADGCRCRWSPSGTPGERIPVGTRVVARGGRGPSMTAWEDGEVRAHVGEIHEIVTPSGTYWCDPDDLVCSSPEREARLREGTRVWARWLDGRWYPGTVDRVEGPIRHILWDDGDSMWLQPHHAVILVAEPGPPRQGSRVLAPRWDGGVQVARVLEREGGRLRVSFSEDEDAWVAVTEVESYPENPFLE